MCKNGAGTISALPDQGPAEQLMDKGEHAAGAEIPHTLEGPRHRQKPAEIVSVTHEMVKMNERKVNVRKVRSEDCG